MKITKADLIQSLNEVGVKVIEGNYVAMGDLQKYLRKADHEILVNALQKLFMKPAVETQALPKKITNKE